MAKECHLGPGELPGVKQEDESADGEVYRDDGGDHDEQVDRVREEARDDPGALTLHAACFRWDGKAQGCSRLEIDPIGDRLNVHQADDPRQEAQISSSRSYFGDEGWGERRIRERVG